MRIFKIVPGVLAGLLVAASPAWSQQTVLSGILSRLLPEARVSWSSGVSRAGTETYEDFFVGQGDMRLRADKVTVTPEGAVALIEAEGLVLNLDSDDSFSLEIGSASTSISASMIGALGGLEAVPDLCRIGAAGTSFDLERLRTLRNVGQDGNRIIRSEMTTDRITVRQDVTQAGSGCELRISIDLMNGQEVRSDKSGTRIDAFDFTLTLPGNLETLALEGAPAIKLSAAFSGFLRQVPGGASVAIVQEGAVQAELSALSAVPALTAYLRTRGGTTADRGAAIIGALTPADLRVNAALEGTTLLAEALVPADRISGLSRASLTSVIGDYRAELQTRSGQASVLISSDIVGVGKSGLELRARLSPPDPDAATLDVLPMAAFFLPRAHLETASLRHQDRGLLRAIELITGSPVSVLAAIYLQDGIGELPENWRAAARLAVSEIARFLSMTTSADGAVIDIRTPTDLSVLETYRLLTLRPELASQLISSTVRQSPPG